MAHYITLQPEKLHNLIKINQLYVFTAKKMLQISQPDYLKQMFITGALE